jgi:hypothetical protein
LIAVRLERFFEGAFFFGYLMIGLFSIIDSSSAGDYFKIMSLD